MAYQIQSNDLQAVRSIYQCWQGDVLRMDTISTQSFRAKSQSALDRNEGRCDSKSQSAFAPIYMKRSGYHSASNNQNQTKSTLAVLSNKSAFPVPLFKSITALCHALVPRLFLSHPLSHLCPLPSTLFPTCSRRSYNPQYTPHRPSSNSQPQCPPQPK